MELRSMTFCMFKHICHGDCSNLNTTDATLHSRSLLQALVLSSCHGSHGHRGRNEIKVGWLSPAAPPVPTPLHFTAHYWIELITPYLWSHKLLLLAYLSTTILFKVIMQCRMGGISPPILNLGGLKPPCPYPTAHGYWLLNCRLRSCPKVATHSITINCPFFKVLGVTDGCH